MGPAPILGNLVNTFDGFTRTYLFQKTKRAQKRDIFQIPHAFPAIRDSNFTNSPGDVGGGGGGGGGGGMGGRDSHMNNMNRSGMLVVPLRGQNLGVWYRLGF